MKCEAKGFCINMHIYAIHFSVKFFNFKCRRNRAQGMLNDLLAALRKEQPQDPLTEEQADHPSQTVGGLP